MLKYLKIYLSIFFVAGVLSLRTNNKLFLGQPANATNATIPSNITLPSNITTNATAPSNNTSPSNITVPSNITSPSEITTNTTIPSNVTTNATYPSNFTEVKICIVKLSPILVFNSTSGVEVYKGVNSDTNEKIFYEKQNNKQEKKENYIENLISDVSKKGFHYDQEKLKNNSLYYNISIQRLENLIEEGINKTISKLNKFLLRSVGSGKCLDNSGGLGVDELNYFFILDCQNTSETQQFTYEIPTAGPSQNTTESSLQTLVLSTNANTVGANTTALGVNTTVVGGNATAVAGNTTSVGVNTTEAGKNTTELGANISKAGFHLFPPENEWVYLKNLNFCIQHNGINKRIIQAPCKNEPAFLWKFTKNSDGTYTITSKTGDQVLDVDGGRKDNGTGVLAYSYNGGNNQKWNIVPLILSDKL